MYMPVRPFGSLPAVINAVTNKIFIKFNVEGIMKPIIVTTDSHSCISPKRADELGIRVLPMPFYIEDKCYLENVSLSREQFFEKLISGAEVSTSQPSPSSLFELWDELLLEYEQIVHIPISSGLSGSCEMAQAFSMQEEYRDRVFVVDNGRVSTPLYRSVLDALELIDEGYSAYEIKNILEASKENAVIYVAVDDLKYLKRGGRVSATTAAIATALNIKPVLKFDIGTLDTYKKCRGFKNARKTMIEAMKNDFETKFKEYYDRGEINLLAASSASDEVTEDWINEIKEAFPGMEVLCEPLSFGLACHIGPDGLGIACSCRPKRFR